jgi:hypothetical protein
VQRFERFVGLVLIGLAALGALLMATAAALILHNPAPADQASSMNLLGFWQLLYSTSAPPVSIIPFWIVVGLLFDLERVVTVWRAAGAPGSSPSPCSRNWSTRCSSTLSMSRASWTLPYSDKPGGSTSHRIRC